MDSSKIDDIELLVYFKEVLGLEISSIAILGLAMISIFGFRTIFAILINKKILSFCRDVQISLRSNMMKAYQDMSYERFTTHDSSDAITNITILTMYFTNNVLYMSLKACAELLLAFFIFSFLISVNAALVFILSFGLGFLVFAYSNFFKTRMNSYGKRINLANSNAVQAVKQALEGVKEVRVLGKENFFYNRLHKNAQQYADLHASTVLINTGSKYFIEFSVMVFFVGSISLSDLLMSSDTAVVFGTLGTFAFAAIRLLPGVNVVSAAVLQLRSQKNTVERLNETILELNINVSDKADFIERDNSAQGKNNEFNSIELCNISYAYPNTKNRVLSNINLEIKRGESVGIIGPSGSGKTTLIDLFLGLLDPTSGEILLNGDSLNNVISDWRGMTAYIPQESLMINESLKANIQLIESNDSNFAVEHLKRSVNQAQLSEVVKNLPDGINTNIGESGIRLSGGQRQRVSLARAIFHSRDVLVFDEATSALDSATEEEVVNEIKKMKGTKTMIIIAHRTETLRFCDRIYRLEDGSISKVGSPAEILD